MDVNHRPETGLSDRLRGFVRIVLLLGGLTSMAGCDSTITIDDPIASLTTPEQSPRVYLAAIDVLHERPLSEEEVKVLRAMMHAPGFTPEVREAALDVLARDHRPELFSTIEIHLPRLGTDFMGAIQWRRRMCEIIAQRGWIELSPTLVRAWAYPMAGWIRDDFERPEYFALAALHGKDGVVDAVFDLLVSENSPARQGLRTSAWTLLIRLNQRDRLMSLLHETKVSDKDAFLLDLQAASEELGIVPVNREEILWIRKLREPERAEFWNQARLLVDRLSADHRAHLELRDLSILIAAARNEPELLTRSRDELYREVQSYIGTQKRHVSSDSTPGYMGTNNQMLSDSRDQLTWGDLAAMLMAVRAMRVPEVAQHLFAYAEDDMADTSTEYGGVIRLDDQHRFEVLEFRPRVRYHDGRFEASQDMFDAGYDAVFHFHFHAQYHKNGNYAGPGFGDLNYADLTRANCLVLTFIDRDTLNVDFYRHGRVVVDLGEVQRLSAG